VQSLKGDILYNGDLSAWVNFANSLRIKALMRISNVMDVSTELQSIYDSGKYISSFSGNAAFSFTAGLPNNFRMANLRDGDFNLYVMSQTMQDVLELYNDPRRTTFFKPTGADGSTFNGLVNGPDASATSISVSDYSLPGTVFREDTSPLDAVFSTSFETLFFLAEAAEKGIISANSSELYNTAVQEAFIHWQTNLPADYLNEGAASFGFNGANTLEQIATQKWLANIINGYEGWIEWKRTGFPELDAVSASLNDNLTPLRMPYPTDEAVLNTENYNTAVGVNGNSINTPMWWQN